MLIKWFNKFFNGNGKLGYFNLLKFILANALFLPINVLFYGICVLGEKLENIWFNNISYKIVKWIKK